MYVMASASEVQIWAAAKINLFLEVLGKRRDGFHEIETLMSPVSLYDTLTIRDDLQGQNVTLHIDLVGGSGQHAPPGAELLSEGTDNTILRAIQALRERAGIDRGAQVWLRKRIPVASGLAGGSTDAAAALVGANLLWKAGLTTEELADIAANVGSDVPFFLWQRSAICRGRGEQIETVERIPRLHLVIVRPPEGLATADVYRNFRDSGRRNQISELVDALQRGQLSQAGHQLHNGLRPAAESLCPWIGRLGKVFDQYDVLGHQMSGSGTSYFGLCRNARHARRIAASLNQRGVGKVYNVHTSR